jgi:enamine deaminase RidA (YjgF/YER057c/UK114 family)
MMQRPKHSSGVEFDRWSAIRARATGQWVQVSGTTATDENGDIVGRDDAIRQTVQTLRNIEAALHKGRRHTPRRVRTRIYNRHQQLERDRPRPR